jgi:hypothetical protein
LLWVKALDAHTELELAPFRRAVRHFAEAIYRLELVAQNYFIFALFKLREQRGEMTGVLLHKRKSSKALVQEGMSSGVGCS